MPYNFSCMPTKLFIATKAFIIHKGKVLILRESNTYADGMHAGKYDVVGGRIETDEPFEQGLLREIYEDTGLTVEVGRPFYVSETWPTIHTEPCHIIRIFFSCTTNTHEVHLGEDHDAYTWIDPATFQKAELIENLLPVFQRYLALN
jgi:8-oxo-dGTP diphosphatase